MQPIKPIKRNGRWQTALRRAAALLLCAACLAGLTGTSRAEGKPLQILLIGVDAYGDADRGRSDTMVLVQADPAAGSVRALSFLRDLYVAIPGCGTTRLNAAYSFGGEKLLKTTLKNNFGVEIDRTVTVSFDSLCHIVDALGGVELEVTEAEREQLNGILAAYNRGLKLNPSDGRLEQSGRVRLSGKQALSYSRIRKIDSDFQRAGRQQKVLAAMLESAKQMNFFTLARLAWTCLREVRTDLTLGDLNALLPLATGGAETDIAMGRVPFDGAYEDAVIDGMQVLRPDLERNRTLIRRFLE